MTQKVISYILVGLIILTVIGFGVLYVFFPGNDTTTGETGGRSGGLFDFLGGGGGGPPQEITEVEEETESTNTETDLPKLRKIADGPIVSAIATTTKEGVSARYIERGTGHIYDVSLETGRAIRQSQTTFPLIQEALWYPGGEEMIIRYFDESFEHAETFAGKLVRETSTSTESAPYVLTGTFLDPRIKTISPSRSEKRVAYFDPNSTQNALITARSDGSGKTQIFSSPIAEWVIDWYSGTSIGLTTKPSGKVSGYFYTLPARGGSLTKQLGGLLGLTTRVSPNGNLVLFSFIEEQEVRTKYLEISTGKEDYLPVSTLSEKCVWSQLTVGLLYCGVPQIIEEGVYPDDWYLGTTSFKDTVWAINTKEGFSTLIASFSDYTADDIDTINLSLTKNEEYLVFKNKKDSSLWALDLREE